MEKFEPYLIETSNGLKVKYFGLGREDKLYEDENGELYYCFVNPLTYNKQWDMISNRFTDNIKDAFELVKNDKADLLRAVNSDIIKDFLIIRFVNREYGEKKRQDFLQDWSNVELGYGIKAGLSDSLLPLELICEDLSFKTPFDEYNTGINPLFFQTKEEAEIKQKEIISLCRDVFKEYNTLNKIEDSVEEVIMFEEKIKQKYSEYSVVRLFGCSPFYRNEKFEIVQIIKDWG